MEKVNAIVRPEGTLDILSKREVDKLLDNSQGGLYQLLRRCSLAVLNCGHETDDCREVFERHQDFGIRILQQQRGVHLELENAPGSAFVDGEMIRGIKEHLFAVLRDIIYTAGEITHNPAFDLHRSEDITNACFHILRNAGVLLPGEAPRLVVCWGGHSINRVEYDYTKEVGHELGLRELEVCTGCGPGAMKGPMKGAAIAHAKQRIGNARHIGVTEPGIIAAEPPNPIVTKLVIMPDIEKRLEAFVRLAHAVIVFPGGVGTAEEILYLLSILLDPANRDIPFPLILAGPKESADYFELLDRFLVETLGPEVRRHYRIVNGHPRKVARIAKESIQGVRQFRRQRSDAYYFNWQLNIEPSLQLPFDPSHANMTKLELHRDQPAHQLAANLRRAFSGIVAGNVKAEGIRAVEAHGPFELRGDPALMKSLDELLGAFVAQHRMKLPGTTYVPCYRLAP